METTTHPGRGTNRCSPQERIAGNYLYPWTFALVVRRRGSTVSARTKPDAASPRDRPKSHLREDIAGDIQPAETDVAGLDPHKLCYAIRGGIGKVTITTAKSPCAVVETPPACPCIPTGFLLSIPGELRRNVNGRFARPEPDSLGPDHQCLAENLPHLILGERLAVDPFPYRGLDRCSAIGGSWTAESLLLAAVHREDARGAVVPGTQVAQGCHVRLRDDEVDLGVGTHVGGIRRLRQ